MINSYCEEYTFLAREYDISPFVDGYGLLEGFCFKIRYIDQLESQRRRIETSSEPGYGDFAEATGVGGFEVKGEKWE